MVFESKFNFNKTSENSKKKVIIALMKKKSDTIFSGNNTLEKLKNFLQAQKDREIVLITDDHVRSYCLPKIESYFQPALILSLPPGEKQKNINRVTTLCQSMTAYDISRDALIINLGGGVVTDLGGFVASIYKRGVAFINIPTTIIGQIDAAIGGKNGINLGHTKNQIGVINWPLSTWCCPEFLTTLPEHEWVSAKGELLKYVLIGCNISLDSIEHIEKNISENNISALVSEATRFKKMIVDKDPYEQHIRQILNFGHTIGHAIEAAMSEKETPVSHGESVAAGIICESFIASKINGFPYRQIKDIEQFYRNNFPAIPLDHDSIKMIGGYTLFDKKRQNKKLCCVLLDKEGIPQTNCHITTDQVNEALHYFFNNFVTR